MRTNFKFALMSAAALLSLGLASCSSNDEAENINPTYDGKAVKTTFSISLPGNVAKTRMAGSTVQVAENKATFRGMSDIVIIPFSHTTNRAARLGENITLGANKMVVPTTTNAANAIPNGQLLDNNNAVLYNDVSIPVGTSAFLFYGKATGTDGYAEGYLTPEGLTGETSGIFFNPTQIKATPTTTVGEALAAYVTAIAAAKVGDGATDGAWWKCTDPANSTQTWYNAGLGDMYRSFTSLKPGASSYVQAAVQDLYTSILTNTNPVAAAIRAAIKDGTNAKDDDDNGILEFQDVINGYPGTDNNSMPDGCAALTWANVPAATDPATQAATATAVTSSTFGGGLTTAQAMDKIVYPASLYYFVDSPVETSVASRQAEYVDTKTWAQILATYTDGKSVTTTTRSVAITNPIQYAVGRLDLKVSKLSATTYYDRRGEEVLIPSGGFKLTGVLIGGQKKVDYNFNQVTTAEEYAIYDKTINEDATPTPAASAYVSKTVDAGTNYTLALETAKDQEVYVALEFLNNSGQDFMGVDGVVKNNCKFYMIARLDPKDSSTEASGQTNTGNKVFAQDYKTIANFSFGAGTADTDHDGAADTPGGFGNAYVTIPDLRTPKLELGFSVDLHWQEGITFTHEF